MPPATRRRRQRGFRVGAAGRSQWHIGAGFVIYDAFTVVDVIFADGFEQ
jgi:hypothetical protein